MPRGGAWIDEQLKLQFLQRASYRLELSKPPSIWQAAQIITEMERYRLEKTCRRRNEGRGGEPVGGWKGRKTEGQEEVQAEGGRGRPNQEDGRLHQHPSTNGYSDHFACAIQIHTAVPELEGKWTADMDAKLPEKQGSTKRKGEVGSRWRLKRPGNSTGEPTLDIQVIRSTRWHPKTNTGLHRTSCGTVGDSGSDENDQVTRDKTCLSGKIDVGEKSEQALIDTEAQASAWTKAS